MIHGKKVPRNEIPMEVLYDTLEVPTHKQFETSQANTRKQKRMKTLQLNLKHKRY